MCVSTRQKPKAAARRFTYNPLLQTENDARYQRWAAVSPNGAAMERNSSWWSKQPAEIFSSAQCYGDLVSATAVNPLCGQSRRIDLFVTAIEALSIVPPGESLNPQSGSRHSSGALGGTAQQQRAIGWRAF
jgi:hypothetical protein